MHDELLYAPRVLRAGALGYLNKSEATMGVVPAIRRVLSGSIAVSEKVSDRIKKHSKGSAPGGSPLDTLSDRELQVFRLIGLGLSTREIAEQFELSGKTIETYRAQIKKKLQVDHNTQLLQRAFLWNHGSENGHRG